jgi:hypothetical protein
MTIRPVRMPADPAGFLPLIFLALAPGSVITDTAGPIVANSPTFKCRLRARPMGPEEKGQWPGSRRAR